MTEVSEAKVHMNGSAGSASSGRSSASNASVVYVVTDGGLVLLQRFLLSVMILCGYDIHGSHEHGHLSLVQHFVRFVRNLYHISKALRKWLSLNYNGGIIPRPPVAKQRPTNVQYRSTPKNADSADAMSRLLLKSHSPIAKCYSEPPKRFSLMDMFKARHGLHEDSVHNNSDFLSHSMSVSSVMSCFLHSFTGYVEDPEAADADMPATSPTDTVNPKLSDPVVEEKALEEEESSSDSQSASESDGDKSKDSGSEAEDPESDEELDMDEKHANENEESITASSLPLSAEFGSIADSGSKWYNHPIPALHFDSTAEHSPIVTDK